MKHVTQVGVVGTHSGEFPQVTAQNQQQPTAVNDHNTTHGREEEAGTSGRPPVSVSEVEGGAAPQGGKSLMLSYIKANFS